MMSDVIGSLGPDLIRLAVIVLGLICGYAAGRYLWASRQVVIAPFPIIAGVAIVGLASSRLFGMANLSEVWQNVFFPFVVSFGAGFSVTSARPPLQSRWWQVWRA